MVAKLLIHKQDWKTWETDEVNQLHLTPLFEFKAMKANATDFYSYKSIHFFYSADPVERSQFQSVAILHFFCGGWLGTGWGLV